MRLRMCVVSVCCVRASVYVVRVRVCVVSVCCACEDLCCKCIAFQAAYFQSHHTDTRLTRLMLTVRRSSVDLSRLEFENQTSDMSYHHTHTHMRKRAQTHTRGNG